MGSIHRNFLVQVYNQSTDFLALTGTHSLLGGEEHMLVKFLAQGSKAAYAEPGARTRNYMLKD